MYQISPVLCLIRRIALRKVDHSNLNVGLMLPHHINLLFGVVVVMYEPVTLFGTINSLVGVTQGYYSTAVQSQKAVSAYSTSKQILPFGFAEHFWCHQGVS